MSANSLIKISEAKTGKLKRIENREGIPIAIVNDGKLEITFHGMEEGYTVKGNKLINRKSGIDAY